MYYPCEFLHWFSIHGGFLKNRWRDKVKGKFYTHTIVARDPSVVRDADFVWIPPVYGGSSSFFPFVFGILYWGYTGVIGIGCPLSNEKNIVGKKWDWHKYWRDNTSGHPMYEVHLPTWEEYASKNPDVVSKWRSMSGNTRELLGMPDHRFLETVF